jgi:hypothetical protein
MSALILIFPLSKRGSVTLFTPSYLAASVTVSPSLGKIKLPLDAAD